MLLAKNLPNCTHRVLHQRILHLTMFTTKTTTEWVVARLYYNEPWLHFLTKCLKPFVDSLTQTGIIERYYWERSYVGGAHISLYFRSTTEFKNQLIIPNLVEHFEAFFSNKPSVRRLERPEFLPNNSVQIQDLQPDFDSWGGTVGLPIAERHFQTSSDVVLDFMIQKRDKWSSDDVLSTAFQMHLGFADAAGMDVEEAVRFFEYCLLYHSTEEFRLQYFEDFFETQREPLLDFHAKLWENLKSKTDFKEDIYNQWIEQCFYTSADLVRTFRLRVLKVEAKFSTLWTLYARLLQKTNNRLGLHGRDESLIFYLMMRSLEKIGIENMKI